MIGFDCGTYNLVCCKRDKDRNFTYKREVNAFIEIPLKDRFVFNMMKNSGVPLIEWPEQNVAYALGEAAIKMAYSMPTVELKRPMHAGCLNPKEKHAQQIMSIMMHSLIENCTGNEPLYYSVPANAINQETDAEYHSLVLKAIFDSFEDGENKVVSSPINEALALVYAELSSKMHTGIGVSCGAGMVNICYSIYGAPVFEFAIVNSGDWIDKMAAKATGETIAFINQEKVNVNLLETSNSLVHQAIKAQYQIMIEKTATEIKKGFEQVGNKVRAAQDVDIVVAGGTSMPVGFDKLFKEAIHRASLPVKVGEVIRPQDPLYAVARGTLIAAEASQ